MVPMWLQAVVLGLVQGLTEFVPISSSAHLVLVPYLFGWEPAGLAFDVALHMGTLGAVLLYSRRDLLAMLRAVLTRDQRPETRLYRRLALLIALGTVPAAVIGLVFKTQIEAMFASPRRTAVELLITAGLLVAAEKARDHRVRRTARVAAASPGAAGPAAVAGRATARRAALEALPLGRDARDPAGGTLADLKIRQATIAGVLQAVSLSPGISRSGATIAGGIFAGLTREAATRFSFLLSIPALFGAGLVNVGDFGKESVYSGVEIALGVLTSFVAGYLAIRWLVALVARERLTGFAWYCVAAGAVGLLASTIIG